MGEVFVKQSYGKVWHFCHNKEGICYSVMTSNNVSRYEILYGEGQKDFDVIIDDSDNIHLICQNKNGDIVYFIYSGEKWDKTVILQSKNPAPYQKNFNIQRINNWINIIYKIEYKGKTMLTHQIIGSNDSPEVLDFVTGNISVARDSVNNINILYFNETEKAYGIKKYIWGQKKWSDFTSLDLPADLTDAVLYIDSNDKIHISGVSGGSIIYMSDSVQILGEGRNPVILEKEFLYIVWENTENGKVMLCNSNSGGASFQNPVEFMSGRFSMAKIFGIRYTCYERDFRANLCYGYISDNIVNLYVLKDFFNVLLIPPAPIEKSASSEARQFMQSISPKPEQPAETKKEDIGIAKLQIQLNHINDKIDKIQAAIKEISYRLGSGDS